MVYTSELTVHEYTNYGDNKALCRNVWGKDCGLNRIMRACLTG